MPFRIAAAAMVAWAVAAMAWPASAQQGASFGLELNNAQDNGTGGCRVTYVARNGSATALDSTDFEVAIFDVENVVRKLLLLKFGDFGTSDTKVSQFDIPDLACGDISSVVINRIVSCTEAGSGGPTDLCKTGLDATSLTAIRFYD
jgi:subtilisin family serine protease